MKQGFETSRGIVEIESIEYRGTNIPKQLYKYRDITDPFHKRLIEFNEVYFASLASFNDPFDCRVEMKYVEIPREHRENRFRYHVNEMFSLESVEVKEKILQQSLDYYANISEEKRLELFERSEHRRINIFTKYLGLFCLTPVKDNIVMWAHYAKNHTGVCIGFDPTKLINATDPQCSFMKYTVDYPEIPISDTNYLNDLLYTKSTLWDYELEYRLGIEIKDEKERAIVLPKDTITEVYFGLQTSREDMINVAAQIKQNNPNVNFYTSAIKRGTFQLAFQLLQIE